MSSFEKIVEDNAEPPIVTTEDTKADYHELLRVSETSLIDLERAAA